MKPPDSESFVGERIPKYKEYAVGSWYFGIGFVYASPETIADVSAEMKQYLPQSNPSSDDPRHAGFDPSFFRGSLEHGRMAADPVA